MNTVIRGDVVYLANEPTAFAPPGQRRNEVFHIDLPSAFLLEEETDGELIVFPESAPRSASPSPHVIRFCLISSSRLG